jgi:nucleoside-diphosphate-sugar epimerase
MHAPTINGARFIGNHTVDKPVDKGYKTRVIDSLNSRNSCRAKNLETY